MSTTLHRFSRTATTTIAIAILATARSPAADVFVALDLDADTAGRQHTIAALPGSGTLTASVSIFDPSHSHTVFTMGYLGGLDRGIAFGHMRNNANQGDITSIIGIAGTAANPGNSAHPFHAFNGAKAFDGPEIQYAEWGAPEPATIQPDGPPVFSAVIEYQNAQPCDSFAFHLADYVSIWRNFPGLQQAGAFSTGGLNTLDTGGDSVPDGTVAVAGIDADTAVPVPPGAYAVDYMDGPASGGPATLRITWRGDLDFDRDVDLNDLTVLLSHFGATNGVTYEDGDIDGDGEVRLADLAVLLSVYGRTCPNP